MESNEISWTLTDRQLCDYEMIMDGSFSPLKSFMNKKDYNSVLKNMRLENGDLFPIPIVLDVNRQFSNNLSIGQKITLREKEGFIVAHFIVENIWEPNLIKEAELVYGTIDSFHPAVDFLLNKSNKIYLGGELINISKPKHYDYEKLRKTPVEIKKVFKEKKWLNVIAFQTRNPMHKAHVEITLKAMKNLKANLFIHPVIGPTKDRDIDYFTRVRCYEHVLSKYPNDSAVLGLLQLAMRMGGPREALLHAIIRKNYGCTHIIIGRDHAGPGKDKNSNPFYHEYAAQKLVKKYENEVGIKMIPFQSMVYVPSKNKYMETGSLSKSVEYKNLSGTNLRGLLESGESIPDWFTYKEVSQELKRSILPLHKRGFTVFFTGLSGSGKSTIANGLMIKLLEEGSRPVTLLDGDIVRTKLSIELGFSKAHRSLNVQRIGYVASEITKNGGVAICAPIAPYQYDRQVNKELITKYGGYVEVSVNTSIEKCEERDSKGLYKLARAGKLKSFTGVSDPYETPSNPDIILNSDGTIPPEDLVNRIFGLLIQLGYVKMDNLKLKK